MNWKSGLKYFFTTIAAYVLIILAIDSFLHTWFQLSDGMEIIIEIFGAVIIYQVAKELFRRYKNRKTK